MGLTHEEDPDPREAFLGFMCLALITPRPESSHEAMPGGPPGAVWGRTD